MSDRFRFISPDLLCADFADNPIALRLSRARARTVKIAPMFRSLRGRLLAVLLLVIAAAIATSLLMVQLFRQSATARVGQAQAEIARACDAVAGAYGFYVAGLHGTGSGLDEQGFRDGLTAVVRTALRNRVGIEGGIWRAGRESLAYAFPTYEGTGPKTDLPQAELPRIQQVNQLALREEHPVESRYQAASQTLLLTSCPLPGPVPELTAWTMTRVMTFAGPAYRQLMLGMGVLLLAVLAAAALLVRLTVTWSRHVSRIESTLAAHDVGELPTLPVTGERELDRIVTALNDAGVRLSASRRRADDLARQMATSQRLAAIGRVAAGIAHEIRNPIAAMRLKAETAMASEGERHDAALGVILEQVQRLDRLVRRLLNVTERDQPRRERVFVKSWLDACVNEHLERARTKEIALQSASDIESSVLDPEQMHRALDNLVLNAIEAAPTGSHVDVRASKRDGQMVLSVRDEGAGPPASIRDHLFEPFVTGRADGTGLGLSIVREVAEAHGGTVRFEACGDATVFEIIIPWQAS
jgi:signal transduction histidine kinase